MAIVDGDIETSILNALQTIFQSDLITTIPTSDSLRLNRLDLAPLQDDPTQVAPYLVYAPAYKIGRMPLDVDDDGWEIDGPQSWITFMTAMAGTPKQTTKLAAYSYINELTRRVERSVVRHYDLSNILAPGMLYSGDRTEWIDSMRPDRMWVRTLRRAYGGDNEFYGAGLMIWGYRFKRVKDFT